MKVVAIKLRGRTSAHVEAQMMITIWEGATQKGEDEDVVYLCLLSRYVKIISP